MTHWVIIPENTLGVNASGYEGGLTIVSINQSGKSRTQD